MTASDMTPFLKQVAEHYYKVEALERMCFVFPNRRSMVFFKKYLCEAVASDSGRPVIAPQMVTVSDFFCSRSEAVAADRVTLLVMLYDCYRELNPVAESLDDFIFWGDVILGDFNDVDKYLADPRQIFTNVADLKNLQDDFEYLTENQRKAIEAFAGHFKEGSMGRARGKSKDVRESFLQIWNIMLPMYEKFKKNLAGQGLAYEGMLYRDFVDRLETATVTDVLADRFDADKFVFVGLNALNECEKKVMSRMRDAGVAEFCWDYTGKMISDPLNRSSYFMARNVEDFPQAFQMESVETLPEFNVVSVPSSYGQVKHVSEILSRLRVQGSDCAVVLPDEGLLLPLLNSIPPSIRDINVTMGYPMSASGIWAFMSDLLKMQLHLRRKDSQWRFYHKHVWDLFSNPLFRKLVEEEDMKACRERMDEIKKEARYYIPEEDLNGFPLFDVVFRPVIKDLAAADSEQIAAIAGYQQEVLAYIASRLTEDKYAALEMDFAKEYWCAVNRLKAMSLSILPATYIHLLDSLLSGLSVPFAGEPLKGLQVMGPLETRALDFRNVIILSCNEGMFPRRNISSSFIPPELRRGFSLPAYEFQDAVWAYYFYRMVSRAENVWMLYDSRTEGLKSGEESRYIKQLRYHFKLPVNMFVPDMEADMPTAKDNVIYKDADILHKIYSGRYSPSSLQNYIDCPMRFYYYSVMKLKKEKEVSESMDPAMIGNVYHNVMWALFTSEEEMLSDRPFDKLSHKGTGGMKKVGRGYLQSWSGREEEVRNKVMALMCEELGTDEIEGRNLVVASVIVRYVMETISRDLQLLTDLGEEFFEIIGLEQPLDVELYGLNFFGVVDRIDRIGGKGNVRLVDYKSGKDDPSVLMVNDETAGIVVEDIFGSDRTRRKKVKAGLQFFIYDRMLQEKGIAELDGISNSMYSAAGLFAGVPGVCPLNPKFAAEMDKRLETMLKEIKDPDIPFRMTEDEDNCKWCDFRMICGR
ncbi:MAG: PD-(D/E)XK nuclease family protein [Bacteroidales bacterium]|nr:PD-(D/E)XK nuclease family protein [Bacteroidales bacterium]